MRIGADSSFFDNNWFIAKASIYWVGFRFQLPRSIIGVLFSGFNFVINYLLSKVDFKMRSTAV